MLYVLIGRILLLPNRNLKGLHLFLVMPHEVEAVGWGSVGRSSISVYLLHLLIVVSVVMSNDLVGTLMGGARREPLQIVVEARVGRVSAITTA